ncbi:serine/threonine-protein kinase [Kribbella sp. NPDC051620]|uniref:serine/threonine-protein kinase n=1 Tax=Kribbella sp. NPDC051620 TaxID=3364120 RepID=UPI0037B24FD5
MSSADVAAGLVAGRYRLGDTLGRGGMGEVHRATDLVLGREVAIKLLLPSRGSLAVVERFRREARAAAMLSDPHVVASYDFGPHGDGYFLAMELVEGRTFTTELRTNGPLEPDRALQLVRQAAAGLAAAHQNGLVHRDIKPGNLLITDDGLVKIADFGIVRILGDTTTTLTATGQIVGTSQYLAPERALGEPAGAASDVYALGCVLYQLVTGHPPFVAEDPASIMYQHVQTMPTPPSELRPQLAGEFEALLLWLLAKDPADRPTAAQVAAGATPPALPRTEVQPVQDFRGHGPSRNVLISAAAVLTIAVASTLGILLDSNSVKLPATTELRPTVAPSTEKPPTAVPKTTASPSLAKPPSTTPRTTKTTSVAAPVTSTEKAGKAKQPKPGKHKGKKSSSKD